MERLILKIGEKVLFNTKEAVIIRIVDLNKVSIQELGNNLIHTVEVRYLQPFNPNYKNYPDNHISGLTDKEWDEAKRRYEIISPILERVKDYTLIKKIAKENKVHFTTIYKWIKLYKETNVISSLIGFKKTGGKGKSRLPLEVELIINEVISNLYLDPSKKSINKIIREIEKICKDKKLRPPHPNTIRNKIKNLSEEEVIKGRYGKYKAREKFEPIKKSFPGANYPLSVVQIDHTKVDIILVDDHLRNPFLRPWLTLAVDVYSRAVVGFHLSFDPPGEMGTGLCIANAILSKEMWLEKNNVEGDWPCWGVMDTIHVDNAKEFRGAMLRRACQNYGVNLEFRPVAQPHWGGHVERLLGTFSKEIHNLPGTTFSTPRDRENYDSQKKSALTIGELEKWLLIYIVNVYHKRIHSELGMSPLQKYNEGILGENSQVSPGVPPRLMNERRLRLDFMPFVERTVQEYGVIIEHITYYDEVLRKYIHSKDSLTGNKSKRKFMFRRDPRDISVVYFFDSEVNEYYEIPYRDTSKPAISIWEYREVVRNLNSNNVMIDEDAIFNAYRNMEEIEMKSIRETKKMRRNSQLPRIINESKKISIQSHTEASENISIPNIEPFEELEDEAFTY